MPDKTIIDVARAAGVGVGTVSRVINRGQSVRPATAALVRQAMDALGYQPPNPEHRRGPRVGKLRRKADRSVMMLLLGNTGLKWILDYAPVYAYVLHGIEAALSEAGRNMIVRNAPDWNAVRDVLPRNRVEGLIVLGSEPANPPPESLRAIPIVWTMGTVRTFQWDHVHPDNTKIGVLAAEYLLKQGHTHCAYLGSHMGPKVGPDWTRGEAFRLTIEEAGGQAMMCLDPNLVVRSPRMNAVDEQVLAVHLDRLLSATPRPTALMLRADMYAPSVYRQLQDRGIRPQNDLVIVTCNNEKPYLNALRPAPVVIDLQAEMIGRRAVDQLLWRAKHPDEPAVRVMVAPKLVMPADEVSVARPGDEQVAGDW